MRIITIEDIRDIYIKSIQRGILFISSKFNISKKKRTKSSFNATVINSSNWWVIPLIKNRWNYLITGNEDETYEEYFSKKYSDKKNKKMISIGSGVCSHELEFARLNPNWEITCIDFSEKLLKVAEKKAKKNGITNIIFIAEDIYKYDLPSKYYDFVLFHSSLHHFDHLEQFLNKVYESLIFTGKLIINEYVGATRLQYNKTQLKEINQCLKLIDNRYTKIHKTNINKKRYYGSGILRMIVSDPSECIESENILPVIHNRFRIVEEKGFGGNLLMPVLKDISHNFIELDKRKLKCLENIFDYEDKYLEQNKSDFVFGIYEKENNYRQHFL